MKLDQPIPRVHHSQSGTWYVIYGDQWGMVWRASQRGFCRALKRAKKRYNANKQPALEAAHKAFKECG